MLTAKLSSRLAITFPRLTSGPTGGKEACGGQNTGSNDSLEARV